MALKKLLATAAVFLAVFTSTAAFADGSGCTTATTPSSTTKPFVCPDVPFTPRHVTPTTESKAEVKAKAKKGKKAKTNAKAKAAEVAAPAAEEKK